MTRIGKWAACLALVAAVAFAAGCTGDPGKGKGDDKAAGDKAKGKHTHPHEGPHDGALAEWDEEFHPEFTVDHKTKTVTVYILGPDAKTPAPIKADKVLLSINKPLFDLDLKPQKQKDDPEGTASVFTGTDDRFGVEQEFAGTLSAEFGNKKYAGDFKEKGHSHKHEKKKK